MTDRYAPDPALLAKAETLTEALPYMQRYAGETFVVKYGGHAMGDPEAARDFAEDVVLMKMVGINVVVVHGGGPQIGAMLKKLGVESKFVNGLRVTDKETAQIAEMVLAGSINKEIVGWIAHAGGRAVGISGKDAGLVRAEKVGRNRPDPLQGIERKVDLGFVGEPVEVDRRLIDSLVRDGIIPVIAPVAAGADGRRAGGVALLPADRRGRGARQAGRTDDRPDARRHRGPARRRHRVGRDDPQARNLRRGGRGGSRCGRRARRAGAARDAAGDIHAARRGDADPPLSGIVPFWHPCR